ncbi:hypothetical protein ZWY2020_050138 [Hordeum vulgare]|nr:hypothetical protein ZWY2020_050138 [Hordeum vulgare]
MATDSGIMFSGEKGPMLEQISAICTKEKLEGALVEARACAAWGVPSSSEPSDPGHRETRGGASALMATVAGISVSVPSLEEVKLLGTWLQGDRALTFCHLLARNTVRAKPAQLAFGTPSGPSQPNSPSGYGLGGSSMALFRRVGGGIYTKAADVGAHLVGKVERNIPDDDPRNPAVIADNVGDNVGDIAGMGSDLFGSYTESSCAALVVASISSFGINHDFTAMCYPLLVSSVGINVCLLTTLFATDFFEIKAANEIEPALKKQLIISTALMTVGVAVISWLALPAKFTIFNFGAQGSVQRISRYFSIAAMYGIAMDALGMLSTMATGLAIDAYGPISDNAGGIAETAGMSHRIRERTDSLDAAGATSARWMAVERSSSRTSICCSTVRFTPKRRSS